MLNITRTMHTVEAPNNRRMVVLSGDLVESNGNGAEVSGPALDTPLGKIENRTDAHFSNEPFHSGVVKLIVVVLIEKDVETFGQQDQRRTLRRGVTGRKETPLLSLH